MKWEWMSLEEVRGRRHAGIEDLNRIFEHCESVIYLPPLVTLAMVEMQPIKAESGVPHSMGKGDWC